MRRQIYQAKSLQRFLNTSYDWKIKRNTRICNTFNKEKPMRLIVYILTCSKSKLKFCRSVCSYQFSFSICHYFLSMTVKIMAWFNLYLLKLFACTGYWKLWYKIICYWILIFVYIRCTLHILTKFQPVNLLKNCNRHLWLF